MTGLFNSMLSNSMLSNSMAHPVKLRCCVFNKKTLAVIFLIVVTNGYALITLIGAYAENHDLCFPLTLISVQCCLCST